MRQKEFTKKQVKRKIETFLKIWKKQKLDGKNFPLTIIIGDYKNNSMNRYIKETLFYNNGDSSRNGATWFLRYPKKSAKKLAKKVMKNINIS
jgi:hypothetical protein